MGKFSKGEGVVPGELAGAKAAEERVGEAQMLSDLQVLGGVSQEAGESVPPPSGDNANAPESLLAGEKPPGECVVTAEGVRISKVRVSPEGVVLGVLPE